LADATGEFRWKPRARCRDRIHDVIVGGGHAKFDGGRVWFSRRQAQGRPSTSQPEAQVLKLQGSPVRRTSQSVAAARGGMLGPNDVGESSSPRSGESM
jgi:hypothetical protein